MDTRCWIQDTGYKIQDAGCWMLDDRNTDDADDTDDTDLGWGYWMRDTGYKIQDSGCWMIEIRMTPITRMTRIWDT